MTIEEIKRKLSTTEYDFLRTDKHLEGRIILLTLGGSYAYGTNVETSDIDIRGCALQSKAELLGMQKFEQFVNEETDTVVYGFSKLIQLLLNCNPNTIEILGCKPEHYLYISEIGRELLANKKLFLSQKAVYSFGGYANQQLRRLENALARDRISEEKKEEHILKSMRNSMSSLADTYDLFRKGGLRVDIPQIGEEITCSVNVQDYPLREFGNIINSLTNIAASFDKLNRRNNKKDFAHLNKHAMHLIRLYKMCLDLLEKEDVVTYREDDHNLLMEIRGGQFQNDDGTYRKEFFDMVKDFERKMQYAVKHTNLPNKPDYNKIEDWVMSVNRRSLDV